MTFRLVTLTLAIAALPHASLAQNSTSADRVRTLVPLLERAGLSAFVVKVTPDGNEYVSVMHIKGAQLLVVRGQHPVPSALDARIAAKDFTGAYGDHNGSTMREGKLFVMDLQADGIAAKPGRNQPFDIAYEDGETEVRFDGDRRAQKMSQKQYDAKFADIDARYAAMLDLLIGALKSAGSGPDAAAQP